MSDTTTNMFTEPEMERTLNKDYILRDYDDLLIAFTVARIEGPRANQMVGNTYKRSGYEPGVNYVEAATAGDLASLPLAKRFDNVETSNGWSGPNVRIDQVFDSATAFPDFIQFCRIKDTDSFYVGHVGDGAWDFSGLTLTPGRRDGGGWLHLNINGTATHTATWELLGDYRALCWIDPDALATATRVSSVADLPTDADAIAALPKDSYQRSDVRFAVVANDGVYRTETGSDGIWGAWRKMAYTAPYSATPHVATFAGLASIAPPDSPAVNEGQAAIVDDEGLLYTRSYAGRYDSATHSTIVGWSSWQCYEAARCDFRASGFFTVHNRARNIYLRLPWTLENGCYRTIDKAAQELNSLDLALVDHTADGLCFMLRDKAANPKRKGSMLLNPWQLSNTRTNYTITGQCFTRLQNFGGDTSYLVVDMRPTWATAMGGGHFDDYKASVSPSLTPGDAKGGCVYLPGIARTLIVEKELMARQGLALAGDA